VQGKEWLSVGGGCRGKDWPERRRRIRRALFEKSVNVERARERRGEERKGSWFLSMDISYPFRDRNSYT
jgi:hypothetical protein